MATLQRVICSANARSSLLIRVVPLYIYQRLASTSSSSEEAQTQLSPLPSAHAMLSSSSRFAASLPVRTFYSFDTYRMVIALERNGFLRSQAVAIMRTMNVLLAEAVLKLRTKMLTKTDLENEMYLYKAALSELATELKMLRQNDHAVIKSETEVIVRDLDALAQRLRDDMSTLKSEIAMEMNNHKLEIREGSKFTDLKIQEVNSKLTIMCSEFKTEIETMKLDATKRVIGLLLGGATGVLVLLSILNLSKRMAEANATTSIEDNSLQDLRLTTPQSNTIATNSVQLSNTSSTDTPSTTFIADDVDEYEQERSFNSNRFKFW